jgi:hypothetical protein
MAERYGAKMIVPDWRARLVCGKCGSRKVDMVLSGSDRRLWHLTAYVAQTSLCISSTRQGLGFWCRLAAGDPGAAAFDVDQ